MFYPNRRHLEFFKRDFGPPVTLVYQYLSAYQIWYIYLYRRQTYRRKSKFEMADAAILYFTKGAILGQ